MGNIERLVEVQDKLQQDLTFLAAPQPRIQNGGTTKGQTPI